MMKPKMIRIASLMHSNRVALLLIIKSNHISFIIFVLIASFLFFLMAEIDNNVIDSHVMIQFIFLLYTSPN